DRHDDHYLDKGKGFLVAAHRLPVVQKSCRILSGTDSLPISHFQTRAPPANARQLTLHFSGASFRAPFHGEELQRHSQFAEDRFSDEGRPCSARAGAAGKMGGRKSLPANRDEPRGCANVCPARWAAV